MPRPAAAVDLAAQRAEQPRHPLDLVDDDKAADLFVRVQVGLFRDLPVGGAFDVEIDCATAVADIPRQRRLAHLPLPKQHHSGLGRQGRFDPGLVLALNRTLYLLLAMEELQA